MISWAKFCPLNHLRLLDVKNSHIAIINSWLKNIAKANKVVNFDRMTINCSPEKQVCTTLLPDKMLYSWGYGHLTFGATKYYGELINKNGNFRKLISDKK
jgi:hypothetical protein